ncbi:hypothetical protein [Oleispirillum naphthae]|uniref:hypothetical protein n=1 Tax=Oleispirillum naphthae TaxID=2838853 RepID=UPI0030825E42
MRPGEPYDENEIEHLEPRDILKLGKKIDFSKGPKRHRKSVKQDKMLKDVPANRGHFD